MIVSFVSRILIYFVFTHHSPLPFKTLTTDTCKGSAVDPGHWRYRDDATLGFMGGCVILVSSCRN
jgi:hypothetical protein